MSESTFLSDLTPRIDDKDGLKNKELFQLRDSYVGRIPEEQSIPTVIFAWKELWSKVSRYLSLDELKKLGEAFVFAANAHGKQTRATGEPYIIHAIRVASILADMKMDLLTLQSALMHDLLEDTATTYDELKEKFGDTVAMLVDGVTKLGKLSFQAFEDYQAENLRKMFLVMAKDIRVVLIKLADRTHNMLSLGALRREKQQRIAKETLEIYAPLAHRLGIYQAKRTLEDLAFKYTDPVMYYEIKNKVKKRLPEREEIVKQAIEILKSKLEESGIEAQITGRAKHFYSIMEKMKRKKLALDELFDLLALRIIVKDVAECYSVLGIIHNLWRPIPGQFDDYIANPKNNMYQSLHTTVIGPAGEPLEVQIRSWDMHYMAEYGVAAHWHYKEGDSKISNMEAKLEWIRKALENGEDNNAEDFMEHLRNDVLTSDVFVFTPKGDVKTLPRSSTPLDFAYAIHTRVGEKCVGAKVNNKIVPIDYELQNGDIVDIITSPQGKPSRDWLNIVKSSKAKTRIRAYFKHLDLAMRTESAQRGKDILERDLRARLADKFTSIEDLSHILNKIARDLGFNNGDDLTYAIGTNSLSTSQVSQRVASVLSNSDAEASKDLIPTVAPKAPFENKDNDIIVEGASGISVNLAHCCKPIPGDAIIGFTTKVRGITVHRENCQRVESIDVERIIPVAWGNTSKKRYEVRVTLDAQDRVGLIADVAQACMNADAHMSSIKASQMGTGFARMKMEILVRDLEHLYSVIAKLNGIPSVIEVVRG